MPICVFDICADGRAIVPFDTESVVETGCYRWWHFDLGDPDLPAWTARHMPEIPAQALLQAQTRPRCDRFEDGIILNLRGINMNAGQPADQMVSVRMWIEDGLIVTVRLRKVFAIDAIRQAALMGEAPSTPASFVTDLIERLTNRIQDEVAEISERTEFYEADLEDDSTPPPRDLPMTRRRVIRLRRYLAPQQDALKRLVALDLPILPQPDGLRLRELANRTTIAVEELDALQDRIVTVADDHDLHVASRQARHGYILSIAAAIFLPLGFLTGVFGVNIAGMPGASHPYAFWILCIGMAALAGLLVLILKFLRWL